MRGYAVAEAGIGRTAVTCMSGLPLAARGGTVVAAHCHRIAADRRAGPGRSAGALGRRGTSGSGSQSHSGRASRSARSHFPRSAAASYGGRTEFVYLLRWPDVATKECAWVSFLADEEWKEVKRRTNAEHGDLVGEIEGRTLVATTSR